VGYTFYGAGGTRKNNFKVECTNRKEEKRHVSLNEKLSK
jgi:hypothetical protein